MTYSIIKVWEVYQSDSETMFFVNHIGYFLTEKDAREAAGTYYDISLREGIKVNDGIFLLAHGVGYNKPISISSKI